MKSLISSLVGQTAQGKAVADYLFLWTSWPTLVGPTLASHSIPIKVDGDTLVVAVSDGITAQSVQFAAPHIAQFIKERAPQSTIDRIKTRPWPGPMTIAQLNAQVPVAAPEEKEKPRLPLPTLLERLNDVQKMEILENLRAIKDLELKESMLYVWVRALAEAPTSASKR